MFPRYGQLLQRHNGGPVNRLADPFVDKLSLWTGECGHGVISPTFVGASLSAHQTNVSPFFVSAFERQRWQEFSQSGREKEDKCSSDSID